MIEDTVSAGGVQGTHESWQVQVLMPDGKQGVSWLSCVQQQEALTGAEEEVEGVGGVRGKAGDDGFLGEVLSGVSQEWGEG